MAPNEIENPKAQQVQEKLLERQIIHIGESLSRVASKYGAITQRYGLQLAHCIDPTLSYIIATCKAEGLIIASATLGADLFDFSSGLTMKWASSVRFAATESATWKRVKEFFAEVFHFFGSSILRLAILREWLVGASNNLGSSWTCLLERLKIAYSPRFWTTMKGARSRIDVLSRSLVSRVDQKWSQVCSSTVQLEQEWIQKLKSSTPYFRVQGIVVTFTERMRTLHMQRASVSRSAQPIFHVMRSASEPICKLYRQAVAEADRSSSEYDRLRELKDILIAKLYIMGRNPLVSRVVEFMTSQIGSLQNKVHLCGLFEAFLCDQRCHETLKSPDANGCEMKDHME